MKDEFGGLGGGRNLALERKVEASRSALAVKGLTQVSKKLTTTATALTRLSKAVNTVGLTAQKTRKALRSLMSFDEINRLSKAAAGSAKKSARKKSSSGRKGSSSSGSGKKSAKDLKETASTLSKLANLKNWKSIKGFQQLTAAAGQLSARLKGGLHWGYENVLMPLKNWTLKAGLPAAFRMLAEGLNVVCGALDVLAPIGSLVWKVFFAPLASWAGEVIVSGMNALAKGFHWVYLELEWLAGILGGGGPLMKLGGLMKELFGGAIQQGLQGLSGRVGGWFQVHVIQPLTALDPMVPIRVLMSKTGVENAWLNLKEQWGNSRTVQTLVKLAKSGWTTVSGWMGRIPPVSEGVRLAKNGWKSVSGWIGKLSPVSMGVKLVKSGWKSVKSWLGDLSARFNLRLPKVSVTWSGTPIALPHFSVAWNAKGGILNGATLFGMAGNTLLGGGEAGKEAVLPLERNTGWMNTLADRVAERSGNGQPIIVQVTLDSRVIGQSTVNYINRQRRMTGKSPVLL